MLIAWNAEEGGEKEKEGIESERSNKSEEEVERAKCNPPVSSSSPTSCGKAVSVKSCLSFEGREREEGQAEIDTPSQRSFWRRWRIVN